MDWRQAESKKRTNTKWEAVQVFLGRSTNYLPFQVQDCVLKYGRENVQDLYTLQSLQGFLANSP